MIRFSFNIGCSESKVIFKRRKKQTCQIKMLYKEQTFAPPTLHSELQQQTNAVNTQKSPPWAYDKGCAEACAERFSALKRCICRWTLGWWRIDIKEQRRLLPDWLFESLVFSLLAARKRVNKDDCSPVIPFFFALVSTFLDELARKTLATKARKN